MARRITIEQLQKRLNTAVDQHIKVQDLQEHETRHIVLAVLMAEGATDAMALAISKARGYPKTLRQEVRWSRNRGREYPGTTIPTNEEAQAQELALTGSNLDYDGGQRQKSPEDGGSSGSKPAETQQSGRGTGKGTGGETQAPPDSPAVKAARTAKATLDKVEAATDLKEAKKLSGQVKMHAGRAIKAAESSGDERDGRAAKAVKGYITKATKAVAELEKSQSAPNPDGGIDPDDIEF